MLYSEPSKLTATFPCGSVFITKTRPLDFFNLSPKFIVIVVLATPPLKLIIDVINVIVLFICAYIGVKIVVPTLYFYCAYIGV